MTRFCRVPARKMLTFLVLALSTTSLQAAENSSLARVEPESVGISSARLRLLDTMLRQHVDDGRVAGLVAGVARHGRIVYLEAMGSQVLAEGAHAATPMREDSIFQIRSNTKAITSLAVMQLIEAGRIGLDDPVSTYIPSFADMVVFTNPDDPDNSPTRAPSRAVTIEDLLLNIGGLSHRDGALYQSRGVRSRSEPLDVLVEKIAAVPLMSDPGTRWIYSESTSVLGRIVEIVSGQRFDDYLNEHVLRPLRMPDTAFHVPPEKVDRLARIYEVRREVSGGGGGALLPVPEMDVPITSQPALLEGSVGLVSTVPDYMRFLQAFLDGGILDGQRVLSEPLIAEMTRNHIPPELLPIGLSPQNPMLDVGWGYGFTVVIDEAKSAYGVNNGEFGWSGTLGTYAWADPETDMVAIIMLQITPASAHRLPQKFKALVSQTPLDE